MNEIQEEELKILKKVIDFLEKENINYFLCGGSLLGAIRHKGFIPWDDDIDIAMPREEYERFIKLGIENRFAISKNLEIASFEINGLPKPFCKILNKEVAISNESKIDNYLWIDIFPIDGLPENKKKIKKIYQKEHLYKFLLRIKLSKTKYNNSLKGIIKKILRTFLKMIKIDFFIARMIKLAKQYNYCDCDLVGNVVWGYGPREKVYKKELEIMKVNFEGIEVNGIKGFDSYLKSIYGDYMTLPPEEERMTHEFTIKREKNYEE